ncbi:MAG TPA: c-type cytochrome domain-containing protein [Sulfuriferula sp.]|nr:c-type cytochrome domain-containing protein [Sulfuriferula sp.]
MHALKSIALSAVIALSTASCSQDQVSFSRDVNPILQSNCAVCHVPGGAGYMKSGFSVATYHDLMKGTKYGPVINPGSSVGSTLVRLIKHQADPAINMPKDYSVGLKNHQETIMPGTGARSLSDHDIGLISKWVDQGAKNN